MTLKAMIEEAKKLSREERGELIDELICLDADAPLTPAQQQDLDRRIDELEAGKAKLIPGDEALAMIRKRD